VDTEEAMDWASRGARIFGILSEEGADRSGVEALSGDVMKSCKRPSAGINQRCIFGLDLGIRKVPCAWIAEARLFGVRRSATSWQMWPCRTSDLIEEISRGIRCSRHVPQACMYLKTKVLGICRLLYMLQ
jgi:hypothetical protein